jgi:pseudaminic acid cytidylyltransferase
VSAIAIIPARGGSRRIKGKNIRDFRGKPIIAYSIEAAFKSGLFDQVIVSTEDKTIASVAESFGAEVMIRPIELADNDIGTQEIAKHVLDQYPHDQACVIYPCAPLMSIGDLIRGQQALARVGVAFAFSIGTDPLRDAGQFYWGHDWAFKARIDPHGDLSVMIPVGWRAVDINVERDWLEAERRFDIYIGVINV